MVKVMVTSYEAPAARPPLWVLAELMRTPPACSSVSK